MIEYPELLVALFSCIGTAIGSVCGVLKANKMAMYRIEQLEKKQDRHNGLIERMAAVEQSCKSAHKRLDELTEEIR